MYEDLLDSVGGAAVYIRCVLGSAWSMVSYPTPPDLTRTISRCCSASREASSSANSARLASTTAFASAIARSHAVMIAVVSGPCWRAIGDE